MAFRMLVDDDLVLASVGQDVLPLEHLHVGLDTWHQDGHRIHILEIALQPIVADNEAFAAVVLTGIHAILALCMVDSCWDRFLAILLALLVQTQLCGKWNKLDIN